MRSACALPISIQREQCRRKRNEGHRREGTRGHVTPSFRTDDKTES